MGSGVERVGDGFVGVQGVAFGTSLAELLLAERVAKQAGGLLTKLGHEGGGTRRSAGGVVDGGMGCTGSLSRGSEPRRRGRETSGCTLEPRGGVRVAGSETSGDDVEDRAEEYLVT